MVGTRRTSPSRKDTDETLRLQRDTTVDTDEDIATNDDPLTEYDNFADPGYENPDERRRDPLR